MGIWFIEYDDERIIDEKIRIKRLNRLIQEKKIIRKKKSWYPVFLGPKNLFVCST